MRIAEVIDRRRMGAALIEAALITFGVLAALGLQGWWEGRQERVSLVSYLVALEQEVIQNDTAIDIYLRSYLEDIQRIDEVFELLADPSRDVLPDGFERKLGRIYFINEPQLSLNAYVDIVSAGSLRLVENASLRESIANYVNLASAADSIDQETWRLYYNSQFPFLVEHAILSELHMDDGYIGLVNADADEWLTPTPNSPHSVDPSVFKSIQFWNLLYGWKIAVHDQGLAALRLKDQIGETLPLLSAEIERLK